MAEVVDKPIKVITDNRFMIIEGLVSIRASRGRIINKVSNPSIKREYQREIDAINVVIAAMNTL